MPQKAWVSQRISRDRSDVMECPPVVLIPGLLCSPRLYAEQIPALWQFGPVSVASHHHDDNIAVAAERVLAAAPPQFALAGLSMGAYLAFEIMRRAGDRVTRLTLLNTSLDSLLDAALEGGLHERFSLLICLGLQQRLQPLLLGVVELRVSFQAFSQEKPPIVIFS